VSPTEVPVTEAVVVRFRPEQGDLAVIGKRSVGRLRLIVHSPGLQMAILQAAFIIELLKHCRPQDIQGHFHPAQLNLHLFEKKAKASLG